MDIDFEFSKLTNGAFGQSDLTFLQFNTGSLTGISNISHRNRSEQFAFFSGLGGNRDRQFANLRGTAFCNAQLIASRCFKLCPTLFEVLQILSGSRYRFFSAE